jgi:hypothetical protein
MIFQPGECEFHGLAKARSRCDGLREWFVTIPAPRQPRPHKSPGQVTVKVGGLIERLKARALKADKSLEQTVRDILTEAAKPSREEILAEMDCSPFRAN